MFCKFYVSKLTSLDDCLEILGGFFFCKNESCEFCMLMLCSVSSSFSDYLSYSYDIVIKLYYYINK